MGSINRKKTEDKLLKDWYRGHNVDIIINNRYRLLFPTIFLVFSYAYLTLIIPLINAGTSTPFQLVTSLFVFTILISIFLFLLRTWGQIISEIALNDALYELRRTILNKYEKKTDNRSFQFKINRVHNDLKDFIESSTILGPPIHYLELDRLQKSIDIYFNVVSKILLSTPYLFSKAQEYNAYIEEVEQESYESSQDELEEIDFENQTREEQGIIDYFNFSAFDESLYYVGNVLFQRVRPYSPLGYFHPIDLISMNGFFDYWNSLVSTLSNSQQEWKNMEEDINKFYEREENRLQERSQRMHSLMDGVIITIVSSTISVIITYFIRIA